MPVVTMSIGCLFIAIKLLHTFQSTLLMWHEGKNFK